MEQERLLLDASNSFCISLVANWPKMTRRLQEADLKATRWPASLPENVSDSFDSSLSGKVKACAQSHINLWRRLLASPFHHYYLILEDDAQFDRAWRRKLDLFAEHVTNPTWELVLLNAAEPLDVQGKWTQVQEQYLTGAYILHKRGAEALLSTFADRFYTADWMTSRLQLRLNSYSFFPWLVIQDDQPSSIGSNWVEDRKKVERCLAHIGYSLENYNP